ncbi:MAG: UrcA family protein [Oceanicaulis sp.]
MKNLTSRAALGAALAAAALTASALAQETPTFEFTVDRAALTGEDAVRQVYHRLEAEAGRYCSALELDDRRALARCRIDVTANVVEAVGEPSLSRYHAEQVREDRMIAAAG